MDQSRKVGGALALGAALLICIGIFTKGWFTASEHHESVGIGPLGIEMCDRDDCESVSFGKIKQDTWGVFGILTVVAGCAAAGTMVFAGGTMLSGKTPKVASKLLRIPVALTIGCATGFIVSKPSEAGDISMGYSMFLTYGGAALALFAVQMVAKAQQAGAGMMPMQQGMMQPGMPMPMQPGMMPMQPQMQQAMQQPGMQPGMQPPMQPGMQPPQAAPQQPQQQAQSAPCPRCQGGMTWVGQYQRWYCTRCQQYA